MFPSFAFHIDIDVCCRVYRKRYSNYRFLSGEMSCWFVSPCSLFIYLFDVLLAYFYLCGYFLGTTSSADHTSCVNCLPGFYSKDEGSACEPCPAGRFSTPSLSEETGSTSCSLCPAGKTKFLPAIVLFVQMLTNCNLDIFFYSFLFSGLWELRKIPSNPWRIRLLRGS